MARQGLCLLFLGLICASFVSARGNGLANVQDSDICKTCLSITEIVADFVNDPATTKELVDFAETRLCSLANSPDECKKLAETYLPIVVDWMKNIVVPGSICKDVMVCAVQTLATFQQPRVHDSAQCAMCKFVLEAVKESIDQPSTADEIEKQALQACQLLPASFRDACAGFVEVYEPMLFRAINATDVEELCSEAGACPAAYLAVPPPPMPAALVSAFERAVAPLQRRAQPNALFDACDTCKVIVAETHALLAKPDTQQQLMEYAKQACQVFPALKEQCTMYVDQYAPLVYGVMLTYLQPDALCGELGYCPAPSAQQALAQPLLAAGLAQSRVGSRLSRQMRV